MISIRTFHLASAKCIAFIAASVVLPTCRPQQAAIRGDSSPRNFSWYGNGWNPRKVLAKSTESRRALVKSCEYCLTSSLLCRSEASQHGFSKFIHKAGLGLLAHSVASCEG